MARELVILAPREGTGSAPAPIASRARILADLEPLNTAPEAPGGDCLYGPGIRIDLPPEQDPVTQMLLTIVDDDIAWSVIRRLLRTFPWRMQDPISGMEWVGGTRSNDDEEEDS
ncbi:MAG: hypothetical protein ACO38W_09400 [Phycisphaerales bacterium]